MDFDKRIDELFLDLPEPLPEAGAVVNVAQAGKLLFLSGVYPVKDGRLSYKGRLGLELGLDAGRLASHTACMQALGTLRGFLDGSLNKVKRIVFLRGFVASGSEFRDHLKVLEGASQLLTDVFGATVGKHGRSAIGVAALPNGAAVELELIVEVK
jgi:enamine deaminase RidA (YjgF/YER057c/UK114 family)